SDLHGAYENGTAITRAFDANRFEPRRRRTLRSGGFFPDRSRREIYRQVRRVRFRWRSVRCIVGDKNADSIPQLHPLLSQRSPTALGGVRFVSVAVALWATRALRIAKRLQ